MHASRTSDGPPAKQAQLDLHGLSADARQLLQLLAARRAEHTLALPGGCPMFATTPYEAELVVAELASGNGYLCGMQALPEDGVVIDVGAHIGAFSIDVLNRAPRARVIAVEPFGPSHAALVRNLALHSRGSGRSLAVHAAAGATTGRSTVVGCRGGGLVASTASTASPDARTLDRTRRELTTSLPRVLARAHWTPEVAEEVCSTVLDLLFGPVRATVAQLRVSDLIAAHAIRRVALLKLDVEGRELEVLAGIDDAHWPAIDAVVLEVQRNAASAAQALLTARGLLTVVSPPAFLTADFGRDAVLVRAQRTAAPLPVSRASAAVPIGRWQQPVAEVTALLRRLHADVAPNAMLDVFLPGGSAPVVHPWLHGGVLRGLVNGRSWARYLIARYVGATSPEAMASRLPALLGGPWQAFSELMQRSSVSDVVAARMSAERMIGDAVRRSADVGLSADVLVSAR